MIIAGAVDEAVVNQWYLTLTVLTSLAIIPVYWCMIALSPATNSTEWVFLIISTTGLSMFIWTWSKFYLDRYVQMEKI